MTEIPDWQKAVLAIAVLAVAVFLAAKGKL